MRSHRTGRGTAGLALCAATIAALVPGGTAGAATVASTTLISVTVDGKPGAGASGEPSVSADGRYVALPGTSSPATPTGSTTCSCGTGWPG